MYIEYNIAQYEYLITGIWTDTSRIANKHSTHYYMLQKDGVEGFVCFICFWGVKLHEQLISHMVTLPLLCVEEDPGGPPYEQ